jgi:CheY-like chemotaxis protein
MKILVIDDRSFNLKLAEARISDHELVTAATYNAGEELVKQQHDFDVVLVDLLMPASLNNQANESKHANKEMPVGIFLALLAAKNGARYVAVFTDVSHHDHPASACMDAFNLNEENPTPFKVGDAKFLLCNKREWLKAMLPDAEEKERELIKKCHELNEEVGNKAQAKIAWQEHTEFRKNNPRGKAWDLLLEYLTKE